ncbi:ATP-binding protein [Aquimarina brevivitae]|uniref:Tetratricopeptide repeat protein n=1 Tax=Aquimarina brevivitae TaxID=323412 RepID=A0A4Q7P0F7_9FLAO|nr:ATP-binding protein [Aquimarina brevivitae]RZS93271.1 tetratricopeptide repeat protein [Aquimarina brevivitae]
MSNDFLEDLLEALSFSPDNIPLRIRVAKIYVEKSDFVNAEAQYIKVLQLDGNHNKAKFGLADCYVKLKKYAAAEIILEELLEQDASNLQWLELLCYCKLANNAIAEAQEIYQDMMELDPDYENEDFDTKLRVQLSGGDEDDFIDEDAIQLVNKPAIDFTDVGGMDEVKNQIALKIIKPLEHQELYKAYGKKIGGGILLYGPPGCGKTHLARATAGEINANFINVGINDILDMWIGNSEKNLHELFEMARRNTPCVIFIDEIDALGANRNDMHKSAGRNVINQFLAELDGIESNNEGILIIGATNTPWHLDPAFRRPGRFDRIIFVSPPDQKAKAAIYQIMLKDKPIADIDYTKLAKLSKDFSGADIQAVIDIAIEDKLMASFADGVPKPLSTKDILKSIKKIKPSTKEWFVTSKNYALYANDSGLYDEILTYLNIKK